MPSDRIQADEELNPNQYTATGHVENHFTVGPAMLWAPFLIFAHLVVLTWNAFRSDSSRRRTESQSIHGDGTCGESLHCGSRDAVGAVSDFCASCGFDVECLQIGFKPTKN